MVYSDYTKQRILFYNSRSIKPSCIARSLEEEGINVTSVGVWQFLKRFERYRTVSRVPGSGKPSKITPEIKRLVDARMAKDDETTVVQLQKMLLMNGFRLSLATILHLRAKLGWTFHSSAYCQLIRDANKAKRLRWAREYHQASKENGFQDVVWTDECSVQLETHRWHSYRRKGELPRLKPR